MSVAIDPSTGLPIIQKSVVMGGGGGHGAAPIEPPVTSVAGKIGDVTLDKNDVGLSNVDNTSDATKPISTATQTALDTKEGTVTPGTSSQYYRGDKTMQTLDKTAVGLANVDNTSDASKPVSTAQQTALDGKQNLDATLTALAGVATAADKLIYATGSDTFTTTDLTAFSRTVLDDTTAAGARTTLETTRVVAGTSATALGTPAKTVTIAGYTPATGDVLMLTLTNGNSAGQPTININGGGAVAIWLAGFSMSVASATVIANTIWHMQFDGTRWQMLGAPVNYTAATQAEMETGTQSTSRWISPLLVKQGIDFHATRKVKSGTSSTGVSTNSKTVTISSYTLTAGDIIAVTLTNGNTATTPTMNVNSGGAVTIQQTSPAVDFQAAAGAIWMLYYTGSVFVLLNNGDPVDAIYANKINQGMDSFGRDFINGNPVVVSQRLNLTYFTCDKIFTATEMRTITGTTAAAATPTTCKMGLYTVNADNSLTLAAKTANNTALWAATNTVYTEPFESAGTVAMVRNQRYAFAILIDTAGATPTFQGQAWTNGNIGTYTPRLVAEVAGQTDIPSSLTAPTGVASNRPWGVVLP